ncbi:type II restriction endonuclease [Robiginitalea aurantiaca]|uniref:Type II restriction endonuclease n=1 Tax=Robiginitalea aurantiaca TaxID=3056915 RepID=A0ABT7WBC9_9FLAO|nr:type II restriction endonuclease [Robiginitalea aurantiaca]MDM9630227.1 type II restriction endonuclease [Robiginitalea aurantiaca]
MEILTRAINSVQKSKLAFSKFITANDVGDTGSHQYGFHIHKGAWNLLFDKPGEKGSNKDRFVTINWQNEFETDSRFIYYGVKTRNEYRITRFGKGFPFLGPDNVGDLLILSKIEEDYYEAFVLSSDEEIENFFEAFNISSNETNAIIPKQGVFTDLFGLENCFIDYIRNLNVDFPNTFELADAARNCYVNTFGLNGDKIKNNPDRIVINWLEAEYDLFKLIENDRYSHLIKKPFSSVEELVIIANSILNRRKSRAGKSLEHHLEKIFKVSNLEFETQVITENNEKPDFIFPGGDAYQNINFNTSKLKMLACKTTCKDRWRQVLNEADRIPVKHLFTLQQGISENQLDQMKKYGVKLVVPKEYKKSFPVKHRPDLLTLSDFINEIRGVQSV